MTTWPETEMERVPIELTMAKNMVKRAAWIGPVIVALFWLLGGPLGAGSAALGLLVVIANFLIAGALLSYAIRISISMYHAAALVGFLLRLGLITGTMLLVVRFVEIDRIAFGIAAVVGYLTMVTMEAIAVVRNRERDAIG
jgi:hypothetical protein